MALPIGGANLKPEFAIAGGAVKEAMLLRTELGSEIPIRAAISGNV
jgi:hypothetical protein